MPSKNKPYLRVNVIVLNCRGGFLTLPQPHETEHFPKSGNGQSRNCEGGLQTLPYKWNAEVDDIAPEGRALCALSLARCRLPPALRATPLINAGGEGAVQWRMVSAATFALCVPHLGAVQWRMVSAATFCILHSAFCILHSALHTPHPLPYVLVFCCKILGLAL